MPIENQEKFEVLGKAPAATEAQATAVISLGEEKQSQCLKAIGDADFCTCISTAITAGWILSDM
jgi:hypothetical protein